MMGLRKFRICKCLLPITCKESTWGLPGLRCDKPLALWQFVKVGLGRHATHFLFSTHTHKGLSTELAGDVRKAAGAHVGTDLGELAHLSNRHEPKQLKLAAFGASASNKKLLVTTI